MNVVSTNLYTGTPKGAMPTDARGVEADRMPLIRQYMRIAVRWRYVILGIIATCIILGLVTTLLMTPKYTALTTVEISRESDKVTGIQGVEQEVSVADQ